MALLIGTKLGPYEIVAPLGAGGMGEVYRAKDTRLGRDVAIKVLPPHLSTSPDLRERFEREARAISSLNHGRICTLHDVGHQEGIDFLVMEFLEGESLAERLRRGGLPLKETVKIGMEICEALEVAHRAGIVHRDLKPGNVMLTKGGAKLMDFGLAKAIVTSGGGTGNAPLLSAAATISGPSPMSPLTSAGQVIGTIQYMSPEQIEGKEADARSDIFALGTVLYEMAAGKRPFEGKSQISLASAILEKEPAPISASRPSTPPSFERAVFACLDKNPDERFQSARDVRLELKWIAEGLPLDSRPTTAPPTRIWWRILPWALAAALLLAGVLQFLRYHRGIGSAESPQFHQQTFERGLIYAARFAKNGRTIYYSANWNGEPLQLYAKEPGSPESRALNLVDSTLFAVSASELAISLGCKDRFIGNCLGLLALAPISGGAPREVAADVLAADWTADGTEMAVLRLVKGKYRVEFPRGKVLYESDRPLGYMRISPRANAVAFAENAESFADAGRVVMIDRNGKEMAHSETFLSVEGLAWSPSGDEVWCGATAQEGWADAIHALSPNGESRIVLKLPGMLRLHDVSRDGRVLLSKEVWRSELQFRGPGDKNERRLSWLDYATVRGISADGSKISFEDWGEAAGATSLGYVRSTDGAPAIKLGTWANPVVSPDGTQVLALDGSTLNNSRLALVPTGAGEPQMLSNPEIQQFSSLGWMPGGKAIYFAGDDGHGFRLYVQTTAGEVARAVTPLILEKPLYFETQLVSPDGKSIFARDLNGKAKLYPTEGGDPHDVAGWSPEDIWSTWSKDGRAAYLYHDQKTNAEVYKLDVATGERQHVATLAPLDIAGVTAINGVLFTQDGSAYVYAYYREFSDLFLVEGVN